MKNFQGLHKCATGAVINTEDFMKTNNMNTGSMLTGANQASDEDYGKKRRRERRRQGRKPCKGYIGN
jgi:hypothetical protein